MNCREPWPHAFLLACRVVVKEGGKAVFVYQVTSFYLLAGSGRPMYPVPQARFQRSPVGYPKVGQED